MSEGAKSEVGLRPKKPSRKWSVRLVSPHGPIESAPRASAPAMKRWIVRLS